MGSATKFALVLAFVGCGGGGDPGWTEAFDASSSGWLLNVCGPSPSDLYAVGGSPDQGVVMHYDGAAWSPVELGIAVPLLDWCHSFGPDDVTIVGAGGTAIHWDGTAWSPQATPTTQHIWGVWGTAPDALWAVGGDAISAGQATLLRFDGQAWSAVAIPPLARPDVFALFKVWGSSATDIYAVGQRGAVLHYDGQQWTEQLVGASEDLISVWGTGPDDIVAVGGRSAGLVSRWDGTSWHTAFVGQLPGFNGVWMDHPGRAYVAAASGVLLDLDPDSLAYTATTEVSDLDFHSVYSADGTHLVAVGGNLLTTAAPYVGQAYARTLNPSAKAP